MVSPFIAQVQTCYAAAPQLLFSLPVPMFKPCGGVLALVWGSLGGSLGVLALVRGSLGGLKPGLRIPVAGSPFHEGLEAAICGLPTKGLPSHPVVDPFPLA
jgi:hypothetical protein